MKLLTLSTLALSLALIASCGSDVVNVVQGGTFSGGSARDVQLSAQSRTDLCCGITIASGSTDTMAQTLGCGKQTDYTYTNSKWTIVSQTAITGYGSVADQLPNCTPVVVK